jgi:hypothetical protein
MIGSPPAQEMADSSRRRRRQEVLVGAWLVLTGVVFFGIDLYAEGFHPEIRDILRGRSLGFVFLTPGAFFLISVAWKAWRQPASSDPAEARQQPAATAQADDQS